MSTDKDRLGDKLTKKEKADEDRYFAEENRKKLEALKAAEAAGQVVLGLCPRCGVALVQHERAGVTIDACGTCNGVWLDKGELETLNEHASEGWMSKWFRSVLEGHD